MIIPVQQLYIFVVKQTNPNELLLPLHFLRREDVRQDRKPIYSTVIPIVSLNWLVNRLVRRNVGRLRMSRADMVVGNNLDISFAIDEVQPLPSGINKARLNIWCHHTIENGTDEKYRDYLASYSTELLHKIFYEVDC